jgi:hypothetical protein
MAVWSEAAGVLQRTMLLIVFAWCGAEAVTKRRPVTPTFRRGESGDE